MVVSGRVRPPRNGDLCAASNAIELDREPRILGARRGTGLGTGSQSVASAGQRQRASSRRSVWLLVWWRPRCWRARTGCSALEALGVRPGLSLAGLRDGRLPVPLPTGLTALAGSLALGIGAAGFDGGMLAPGRSSRCPARTRPRSSKALRRSAPDHQPSPHRPGGPLARWPAVGWLACRWLVGPDTRHWLDGRGTASRGRAAPNGREAFIVS